MASRPFPQLLDTRCLGRAAPGLNGAPADRLLRHSLCSLALIVARAVTDMLNSLDPSMTRSHHLSRQLLVVKIPLHSPASCSTPPVCVAIYKLIHLLLGSKLGNHPTEQILLH